MNARHKKFILNKLIPFILREQGRGFGMDDWKVNGEPGEVVDFDGLYRKIPVCGTVCCIGGSIQILRHRNRIHTATAGKDIGLTPNQAHGLFINWTSDADEVADDGHVYGWPKKFADKFDEAQTPYRKAQVAVSLLKEVVKTNGECLRLD